MKPTALVNRRPLRPEELFDIALTLRERAEKAEAEVERLRGQLQLAVDIAEWYMDNLVQSPRKDKLEAIKATLNPDNK
jgi:predicted metal-dependent TIM-barrel fold hydrolase